MNKMLFVSLLWFPESQMSQLKHKSQCEKKAELAMVRTEVDSNYMYHKNAFQ